MESEFDFQTMDYELDYETMDQEFACYLLKMKACSYY
jgi:hypothetical protein